VSIALDIQHAKRMRLIAICGLSVCTTYFRIISFSEKKNVIEHQMCVLIFSATYISKGAGME